MNSREIAEIAGVSRSTVSRVINNYSNVPPTTREKVMAVVKKYNYVPDVSARALVGKTIKVIGLFIVDHGLIAEKRKITGSPYFGPFVMSVLDNASKYNYNVLVSAISREDDFLKAKAMFINKSIAGGIFIGNTARDGHIDEMIREGYKVAVIDYDLKMELGNDTKCILVGADNLKGGYFATKYLIDLGHRVIAHVAGEFSKLSGIQRFEGYKKALKDADIRFDNKLIFKSDFREKNVSAIVKRILRTNATAVFCCSDSVAYGIMREIQQSGYMVPDDISIIGFDDAEMSSYMNPPLTTVRFELLDMARHCVSGLINIIEEDKSIISRYTVPVEIVERKSCRRLI